MKQPIYLNYAATSNYKFESTIQELSHYLEANNNINTNRGLQNSDELGLIFETRVALADFFMHLIQHILFSQQMQQLR